MFTVEEYWCSALHNYQNLAPKEQNIGPDLHHYKHNVSSHFLQNNTHSDLQNTKHISIHYTQKYIKMSLPCNSKALTVKLPHLCANWLNTAVRCANTRLLNCRHTNQV